MKLKKKKKKEKNCGLWSTTELGGLATCREWKTNGGYEVCFNRNEIHVDRCRRHKVTLKAKDINDPRTQLDNFSSCHF